MAEVVRLVAWCDLVTLDDHRAELARWDWPAAEVAASVANAERSLTFRVEEVAVLADASLVLLSDDRGWGSSSGSQPGEQQWAQLTREDVVRTVLNVVLPDDAEVTGDTHSWDVLAARLREHGIPMTDDDLRRLPYVVELSERLEERLGRAGAARCRGR